MFTTKEHKDQNNYLFSQLLYSVSQTEHPASTQIQEAGQQPWPGEQMVCERFLSRCQQVNGERDYSDCTGCPSTSQQSRSTRTLAPAAI